VPFYIASDVHLRLDRPERGRRFAAWVRGLEDDATVLILGDLCDFWLGTRSSETEMMGCDGIRALADFCRRGGSLSIMAGNHDRWLCPFYERSLGASIVAEPLELTTHGLRLHLVHGHLLGARRRWKALMESREFFSAFALFPSPLAGLLDRMLEMKNHSELERDEERHLALYRRYAAARLGQAEVVVIGHVHRAVDERESDPRLIVLGGWQHRSSFLRIDPAGASLRIVADEDPVPAGSAAAASPLPSQPRLPIL
jgi:UDP-2,3-diacylglucosamine hydrolase